MIFAWPAVYEGQMSSQPSPRIDIQRSSRAGREASLRLRRSPSRAWSLGRQLTSTFFLRSCCSFLPLVLMAVILCPATSQAVAIDPTFGIDGFLRTDERLVDLAVDPAARIITLGYETPPDNSAVHYLVLTRYLANGTPDTSFASGGRYKSDLPYFPSALQLQADGKILVAGSPSTLRFDDTGALDPTFGDAGAVSVSNLQLGSLQDLIIDPDQRVVLLADNGNIVSLLRLEIDGSFDETFGSNGLQQFKLGAGIEHYFFIASAPSELILFGGFSRPDLTTGNQITLARLTASGGLDSSFGSGGIAYHQIGSSSAITTGFVLPDGHILVGGSFAISPAFPVLGKYTPSGEPDVAFGNDGYSLPSSSIPSEVISLAVDHAGKLLFATRPDNILSHGFVGRANEAGQLDNTFGCAGLFHPTDTWDFESLAIQDGSRLLLAGRNLSQDSHGLLRLTLATDDSGSGCPAMDQDSDGVPDSADECPNSPPDEPVDAAGCGCSQLTCDDGNDCNGLESCVPSEGCQPGAPPRDGDGDGHVDPCDNCPFAPNSFQADSDGDGDGDACDVFEPPNALGRPLIRTVLPKSVEPGDLIVVWGKNFDQAPGSIQIDSTVLPTLLWTDLFLSLTTPDLPPGQHEIKVTTSGGLATKRFTVLSSTPSIREISPRRATEGSIVTIRGVGFGNTQGSSTIRIGDAGARIESWGQREIAVETPQLPNGTYDIAVHTTRGEAHAKLIIRDALVNIAYGECDASATDSYTGHCHVLDATTTKDTRLDIGRRVTLRIQNTRQRWYELTLTPRNGATINASKLLLSPSGEGVIFLSERYGSKYLVGAEVPTGSEILIQADGRTELARCVTLFDILRTAGTGKGLSNGAIKDITYVLAEGRSLRLACGQALAELVEIDMDSVVFGIRKLAKAILDDPVLLAEAGKLGLTSKALGSVGLTLRAYSTAAKSLQYLTAPEYDNLLLRSE